MGHHTCFCRKKTEYKKFIAKFEPIKKSVSKARIVFLGPAGAGKSSFLNSVISIFRDNITSRANPGIPTVEVRFSDATSNLTC